MEQSEGMVEQELAQLRTEKVDNFLGKYRNIIFAFVYLFAVAFFIYAWIHLQAVINDPCDICVNHTGATCSRIDFDQFRR